MIDNRIHYYLALDTETTNGLEQPFVYDIGGAIVDKQGRIMRTRFPNMPPTSAKASAKWLISCLHGVSFSI